jgi:hypothetical protein
MTRSITALLLACLLTLALRNSALGQGYYDKTVQRNPATGRQEIIDLHVPHSNGQGHGGLMFDGPTGCLQLAAVDRNPRTGRLEYYNQYMNPWSGARYTTATRFNPFTKEYETAHRFLPPPQPEPVAAATAPVETLSGPTPVRQRGTRVINVAPPEKNVQPAAELAQPNANPLTPQKYPRGGVTIKILEPSFPTPPAAVGTDAGGVSGNAGN